MNASAPAKPLTAMQALSNRLRRAMLIAGVGVMAAVIGSVILGPLPLKLAPHLAGLPRAIATIIGVFFGRFWLIVVLPAFGYVLGRTLKLSPVALAFGAAISGEVFFFMIEVASLGLAPLVSNLALTAARVGTLALGILLTLRTTRAGEHAAARAQAAGAKVSEAKRAEYAELMAEAHRLAERNASKAAPAPAAEGPAAGGAEGAPTAGGTGSDPKTQ